MSDTRDDGGVERALVLAAGKSSRIRLAVSDCPKPLIEVGGRSVLEHNLRWLFHAGVHDVWINLHYRASQIVERIGDGSRYGLRVQYSWEPELLGTAGAPKKLEPELRSSTFAVVYADNLIAFDFNEMVRQHRKHDALATIAVFDERHVPNTGMAGGRLELRQDRQVSRIVEGGPCDSPYVNAGVYLLEPAVLDHIPASVFSDFGRDVFPALLRQGERVAAYPIDGYCLALDTPEALERARRLVGEIVGSPAAGGRG